MQKRYRVTLTDAERQELQSMVSTGRSAARKLVRSRILLLADQAERGPAKSDPEIVEALGCGRATVERVRQQFVEEGIEATLTPRPTSRTAKYDSEYERRGTANLFLAVEPLAGKRTVRVTDRRSKIDWAQFVKFLLMTVYPEVAIVVLVMDNLNTHSVGSLYEAFDPATARGLAERLEIHHTPKHGSWLNMAETELSVLSRQCLERRIDCKEVLTREVTAWEHDRNGRETTIDWQFTTADARIKLKRLYPSFQS